MENVTNFILTNKSVNIVFADGKITPVPAENPVYGKVVKALHRRDYAKVEELLDISKRLVAYSKGQFYLLDGVVYVNGSVLPDALSKRLIAFADQDLDCQPLINFWKNLSENPSEESKKDLFGFLESNHVPITEDGCFIGYKAVRKDFKDRYTGTMDNSVGKVVKMVRKDVNADRNITCSHGLHVAAFDYAKHTYGTSEDVVVLVKVNPKDVVSVPTDYNQQKMRVCEYTVMDVFEGEKELNQEVFTNVGNDEDVEDGEFEDTDTTFEDDWDENVEVNTDLDSPTETPDFIEAASFDNSERVCLSKKAISHLGLSAGDTAYVLPVSKGLLVSSESFNAEGERTYTVDRSGNVRLTKGAFKSAGLGSRKNFTVSCWEDELEVA